MRLPNRSLRRMNRHEIRDLYVKPWFWGICFFVAGIPIALGGTVALLWVSVGILGSFTNYGDWRGWLGIGVAVSIPLSGVYRTLSRWGSDARLNRLLIKSSRGRDLVSRWY